MGGSWGPAEAGMPATVAAAWGGARSGRQKGPKPT